MRNKTALLMWFCAAAACAQTIDGRVFDQSGGVVAGARVVLLQDFSKIAETKSGQAGEFAFHGLKAGTYQVQVKQPMFQIFQELVQLEGTGGAHVWATLSVARAKDEIGIVSGTASGGAGEAAPEAAAYRPGGKIAGLARVSGRMPAYPESAARRGAGGTVVLSGAVKTDGSVGDIRVLESPDAELAKAAADAYATWQFTPMKLNGEPVEARHLLVLRFGRR
jgi:TonB family protein